MDPGTRRGSVSGNSSTARRDGVWHVLPHLEEWDGSGGHRPRMFPDAGRGPLDAEDPRRQLVAQGRDAEMPGSDEEVLATPRSGKDGARQ